MARLILNGAELAQKSYVDDAINNIPAPDLSDYATISYVDGQLGVLNSYDIITTNVSIQWSDTNDQGYNLTDTYVAIADAINRARSKGLNAPLLYLITPYEQLWLSVRNVDTYNYRPRYIWFYCLSAEPTRHLSNNPDTIRSAQLACNLSWDATGEICTVTSAFLYPKCYTVLSTDNTWAYTPTGDYNPATKKYVDDLIANIPLVEGSHSKLGTDPNTSYWCHVYYAELSLGSIDLDPNTGASRPFIKEDLQNVFNKCLPYLKGVNTRHQILLISRDGRQSMTWSFGSGYGWKPSSYQTVYVHVNNAQEDVSSTITFVPTFNSNDEITGFSFYSLGTVNTTGLPVNNTVAYTPTGDYNPATKKYIDDALSSVDLSKVAGFINLYDYSSSNPLVLSTLEPGLYILSGTGFSGTSLTMVARPDNRSTTIFDFDLSRFAYLLIQEKIPEVYDRRRTAYIVIWGVNQGYYTLTDDGYSLTHQWSLSKEFLTTSTYQTVSGKKTFSTLPESSVTPTTDNQLVNKKYVDDNLPDLTDYATKSYVDKKIYILNETGTGSNFVINTEANKATLANIIQDISLGETPAVFLRSKHGIDSNNSNYIYPLTYNENNGFWAITNPNTRSQERFYGIDYHSVTYYNISWSATITDEGVTVSSISMSATNTKILMGNNFTAGDFRVPLGVKNTSTYIPTNDYNPATKKYVDDTISTSINNKIWIGTQAEYDALSTYSDDTLYFIKETQQTSY